MNVTGRFLLATVALAFGCAAPAVAPSASPRHDVASEPVEVDQATSDDHAAASAEAPKQAAADARQVGDYVTFAFSGAYRKAPLKLTQRVVDRSDSTITIDYTFSEPKKTETLRVKTRAGHGDLLEVVRVAADGSASPIAAGDFEARMAQTVAIADENEALIDESATTVRVGEAQVPAKRSTYKVRVGQKTGTLETTVSEAFAWGDLGGKITTSDGKTFFSAELVDAGGPAAARASLE